MVLRLTDRILVFALLLAFDSTACCARDQSDVDGLSTDLGLGLMNFDLAEYNQQDEKLVQESGWVPGIDASLAAAKKRARASLRVSYYAGELDYDGQTQSGMSIASSSDQTLWDFEALAAYRLPFLSAPRTSLYAGGGYRHWQRDIQSIGSISGLDETYRWWSSQGGVNLEWRQGANVWSLDGRLTRTFNPRVDVDFHRALDSVTLDLGERWGWMLELAWRHRLSTRLSGGFSAFLESWELGKSGLETLTAGGIPVGNVFQPRIENRNFGFIMDIRHHW